MKVAVVESSESAKWEETLAGIGKVDPYYLLDYVRLYDAVDGGRSVLFTCQQGGALLVYPFRIRPLKEVPGLEHFAGWYDITTNYGYGGPLVVHGPGGPPPKFLSLATSALQDWCAEQAVVSEFCRFHPLLDTASNVPDGTMEVVPCNKTVWLDLSLSDDEMLRGMRKGHRYDVKKARKEGVRIEFSKKAEDIDAFTSIYQQTMQSVRASDYYFFDRSFFADTLTQLGDYSVLVSAFEGDRRIAASIFLLGDEYAHYHFSGMVRDATVPNANKLLLYEVARFAKASGLRAMHLGGGIGGSDDDSLMRFKSGFSKLRAQFHIGKRIHSRKIYDAACEAVSASVRETFFPAYRATTQVANSEDVS
jgi:hypothetical protein